MHIYEAMENKRGDILILLLEVEKLIPKEEESCFQTINSLKESLGHTAPEILDLFWNKIYNYLSSKFTGDEVWHGDICNLYNDKYKEYVKKYKKN